jgi:hypothetical protein
LTNAEKNYIAMNEAAFLSTAMIVQEFGYSAAPLPLTGTFSDTGWSLNMSGAFAGLPLSLSFTGTFNTTTGQGSYTSSGTFGSGTWSSPGSWTFSDIDPVTAGLTWDATATIAFPGPLILLPDVHIIVPKRELTTDDGTTRHTVSQGMYVITIAGIPIKTVDQTDDSIGPSNRNGPVIVSVASNQAMLTGTINFANDTFAGSVAAVPEPASLSLFSIGALGLLGCCRFMRSVRR